MDDEWRLYSVIHVIVLLQATAHKTVLPVKAADY